MNENDHGKLKSLITDVQIAMLTTLDSQGKMHARPMITMAFDDDDEFEGVIWFFTRKDSYKVHDLESAHEVNLTYSEPKSHKYVSVFGTASVEKNKNRMIELWRPTLKTWFPEGIDDPQLTLIKVKVEDADFWDTPASTMMKLKGIAKSLVTGHHYDDPGVQCHHVGKSH